MAIPGDEEILPLANHDTSEWPNVAPLKSSGSGITPKLYGAIEWSGGIIPLLPKAMIGLLIVAGALLIVWAGSKAVFQDHIIVEALSVTKELEARGYSGAVVTKRVLDEVSRMNQVSKTSKERAQLDGDGHQDLLSNIQLPKTGLSVQTIVAIVRDLFHQDETRIGGEVTGGQQVMLGMKRTKISLLIRTEHKHVRHTVHLEDDDLDLLIEQAAVEVLNRIDPYVLASYYYQEKLWDKMDETVDNILATRDPSERKWALILRGNRFRDQGRRDEAITYYDRAILLDGRFSIAFLNKGNIFGDKGDHESAIEAYRTAVAMQPRYYLALNNWAYLLFARSNYDEAIAKLYLAMRINPVDVHAHKFLGIIWDEIRDYEQAAVEYQIALEAEPTDATLLMRLGTALYRVKNVARATARFNAALKRMPQQDVYNAWGDALLNVGDVEDAQQKYKHVLEHNYQNAYAHIGIGRSWIAEGHIDKAEVACGEAIAADKYLVAAHVYCGSVFSMQKNPKAAEYYKQALALVPENSSILAVLAGHYYAIGEPIPGAEHFEKAIQIDPGRAYMYLNWGNALFNMNDYSAALGMYDKAISLNPNYEEAYRNRSDALKLLDRDEEATRSNQKADDIAYERSAVIRPGRRSPTSMIELYYSRLPMPLPP
jgi:tetratricopeptide (TPR) repeat protein